MRNRNGKGLIVFVVIVAIACLITVLATLTSKSKSEKDVPRPVLHPTLSLPAIEIHLRGYVEHVFVTTEVVGDRTGQGPMKFKSGDPGFVLALLPPRLGSSASLTLIGVPGKTIDLEAKVVNHKEWGPSGTIKCKVKLDEQGEASVLIDANRLYKDHLKIVR